MTREAKQIWLLLIIAFLLMTASAFATERVFVQKQVQAYQYPANVSQTFLYSVGGQVRSDALMQQAIAADPELAAIRELVPELVALVRELRAMRQGQGQPVAGENPLPPAPQPEEPNDGPLPNEVLPQFLADFGCAKCHSGAAPKGSILLEAESPLDPFIAWRAVESVRAGRMPKGKPLDGIGQSQFIDAASEYFSTLNAKE